MPYIRVRPEGLQRMSEMLDRVEKDIEQREEAFSIVSRNLDWQVKREEDIDWQLRCICIELQEEKQKIAEIAEYLRRASVIYEKLEKNLQDEDERSLSYGTVYNQNEQETPFGTAYVAVYSWLLEVSKNIMKAVSEKNKDEVTGLAGDLVSYCNSLIKFFTGDSKHAPFGIGQWCKLSKASASDSGLDAISFPAASPISVVFSSSHFAVSPALVPAVFNENTPNEILDSNVSKPFTEASIPVYAVSSSDQCPSSLYL